MTTFDNGGEFLVSKPNAFSADYTTARKRFCEAATRLGWQLEAHSIGASGPLGEELTLDVARSAHGDPARVLVVSSGLHGVEGFFGSAVQLALLEEWASSSPPATQCVFLHGLNPFGFAWLRRVNEDNVDLNRNFLLPGERFEGSPPTYTDLDGLLNPRHPPSRWEPFILKTLWAIARHGMPALRQSVAAGQYEFPSGLFFGGAAPSRIQQIMAENLERWLGGSRHVVHLDLHTGLGPQGTFKLLIDYPLSDLQRTRLTQWFGADSFEMCGSGGIAYIARGSLGRWCVSRNLAEDYLFAFAEFGTCGPIPVLAGLRAENQAHHWGTASEESTLRAKQRLKELFCPSAKAWRTSVLQKGIDLVDRALGRLAKIDSPIAVIPTL
jgi:hypothetical protein